MPQDSWTDEIIVERMDVDQAFAAQLHESRFSSQEWGLIMAATEFTIEQPDDPDAARIIADTEQLDQVLPELDAIRSQLGGESRSSGGIITAIKETFGLQGDVNPADRAAAERLTQEYAEALQTHLEDTGRWPEVRRMAAEQRG